MSVHRASGLFSFRSRFSHAGLVRGKQYCEPTVTQTLRHQSTQSDIPLRIHEQPSPLRIRKYIQDDTSRSPQTNPQAAHQEQDEIHEPQAVKSTRPTRMEKLGWVHSTRKETDQGNLFSSVDGKLMVQPRQLRNACKCEKCVHPSDRQRNYLWTDVPLNIRVASHEVDGDGTYHVRWYNDVPGFKDHVSTYTKQDIIVAGGLISRHGHSVHMQPRWLWDKSNFRVRQNTLSYENFMTTSQGLATGLHRLMAHGLVFIENVPEDEESVARLAERIGPIKNTFYGRTWDVRSVARAKNVAYTSRNLGYHMDLLYMAEPPGLQLLHCIQNTCEGGLSRFADTFKALDNLISRHGRGIMSDLLDTLVAYEYSNDGSYYYDRKPIVSYNHTPYYRRDVKNTRHADVMSRVTRVFWSPQFTAPHMGIQTAIKEERMMAAKAFGDALEEQEMTVTTKLPPGTCAIFDNLRVVHARTAFDTSSGHRWLKGAYVNHQDFWSKATSLEREIVDINRNPWVDGQ